MFDSAPLEPVTRVPEPAISIAMMPVVVIDIDIVDPVRLSFLAERYKNRRNCD